MVCMAAFLQRNCKLFTSAAICKPDVNPINFRHRINMVRSFCWYAPGASCCCLKYMAKQLPGCWASVCTSFSQLFSFSFKNIPCLSQLRAASHLENLCSAYVCCVPNAPVFFERGKKGDNINCTAYMAYNMVIKTYYTYTHWETEN